MVEEMTAGGSEHLTLPIGRKSPRTLALIPTLRRFCRTRRVDVLHARSRVPAWLALATHRSLPKKQRPRFLTTMHGLHSVGRFSSVMSRGERVVAVSNTVRDHILQHYGSAYHRVAADRISVVRNGIDHACYPHGFTPAADWQERFDAEFPQVRGRRLVTLIGRLTRLKGHHDLLAVMKRLPPDWHALIVGGDDPRRQKYADDLRATAATLGDRVTFTGHRRDARELAAVSQAVVSLSTKPESFGRTVLESLALGVPVVGYAHGGVGEVLGELFPEGAVPVGEISGVSERLQTLAQSGCRPQPFQSFRLDDTCRRMIDVYESACGLTGAAPPRCDSTRKAA